MLAPGDGGGLSRERGIVLGSGKNASVIPELKKMSTVTERAGEWATERMRVESEPERIAKEDLIRKGNCFLEGIRWGLNTFNG